MTHTTSVITTTRSALTWRTNVLRCLIQCVRQLMQTLLRMLNTSSTTSKRHGTVTMKTQRSRSDIFQLSTWRLRSKETGIFPSFPHVSSKPVLTLSFLSPLNWSLRFLSPFLWVNLTLFLFRHDCGFHMLEYLAKWEGRRVPVVTAGMVVELCKIYTWNWLMNEDYNTWANAREFIEEAVKRANKKYKWW